MHADDHMNGRNSRKSHPNVGWCYEQAEWDQIKRGIQLGLFPSTVSLPHVIWMKEILKLSDP